ncbi:MAG: hypothetical protein ABI151_12930 [Chitinophagaceae bacterium]
MSEVKKLPRTDVIVTDFRGDNIFDQEVLNKLTMKMVVDKIEQSYGTISIGNFLTN